MRLLILATEFPPGPGGIGTHAYQLAAHLAHMGWQTRVLADQHYAAPEEIKAFNLAQPFEVTRWRAGRGQLLAMLLGWRPGVVLASGRRAVWLAGLLRVGLRFRLVAVGHGSEFAMGGGWQRRLTRWAFERADAVVCVSRFTWGHMLAQGIRPRAGQVIHNGADAAHFYPLPEDGLNALRRKWGAMDKRVLLAVGNVTPRKAQDVVIRALPEIVARAPEAVFWLAGLPTGEAALRSLARSLGVEERIRFLGRVDNDTLRDLYNLCDVFVMTSRHTPGGDVEGYGIAAIEAALCGKPAIVTAGGGLVEAIAPGETGLVVPPDDPPALAEAVVRLLADAALRDRLGRAARSRSLAEQTWARCAEGYRRVLSDGKPV